MGDLLQRLRERKLVQWALAYVAASFALIQMLDIVAQRFGWPEQTVRFVIVAMCVGFFVTLVIAWYHGERGAQRVTGIELLIIALLLAIGGAAIWRFAPRSSDGALASNDTSTDAAPTDPKSIAVLPFVNMSGEKDNEYFSDGISEEILNVLAGIPELRVAARTSSFSFRDGKHEAPEIAHELHVRLLLEGSVRKQGDRARITAQLIDASNGYHLWSQTYDRELKDIFAIQDEIAAAIANELKVKIGGADETPQKKPHNVEAYDFYLRGLALWQTRGETQLLAAIKNFESATAADPQFAEAYAGLGLAYIILPDFSSKITYSEAMARARNYAELALSIDPSVPEIYPVFGILADSDRRRKTAQALYRRAIALRPSFATSYQWLGTSMWSDGDLDGGLKVLEQASMLDPKSSIIANNHGMELIALGRYQEAIALCAPLLKSTPDDAICLESTAFATMMAGDYVDARAAYEHYARVINPSALGTIRDVFDALEGHGDRHAIAVRVAAFMPQSSYDPKSGNVFGVYVIPPLLVLLGEPKLVFVNMKPFAATDLSGQSEWALLQVSLGSLHCDPQFVALVKEVKTIDPYYDKLCLKKP
ncbi:MAG TPA: tetratricopeptide repeat protein [Rudaea sp.]|jgi:TolB-like protein/Flp pilus assembly protein TadD|nr:tetratricopeptide repeat protein [Rudaea sp.]